MAMRELLRGKPLGPREIQVSQLMAEGLCNKEIADRMGVSEGSIKQYVYAACQKLGIDNRTKLALWAVKTGIAACMLMALVASPLIAQPVLSVTGPTSNVKAGSTVTLSVTTSGVGSTGDQAIQFSLSGISWPVVVNAGTAIAGKTVTCAQVGTLYNCVVAGGSNPLADGQLASLSITLPKSQGSGTVGITLGNILAAITDATGNVAGASVGAGSPFGLNIISLCDITGDGKVDTADTGAMVMQALGVTACTSDLNSDSKCNVLDVQIVAGAAVSGLCAAK